MAAKPGSGDVVWLDFTPTRGHEQSGRRPALVISPKRYNEKSGLALVCPITTSVHGYPFEVPVTDAVDGVILVDQVRTVDWRARGLTKAGTVPIETLTHVRALLHLLIDPDTAENR